MPFLQVKNGQTFYEQIGNGEPLVLLHGWRNTLDAWSSILPILSQRYRLVIPDLPGFGKSIVSPQDEQRGWTTPDYCDWLENFVSILKITPVAYVGHSYGGKILLEHGRRSTHRTPKQILIAPSGVRLPLTLPQTAAKALSSIIPPRLKQQVPSHWKKRLYSQLDGDNDYLSGTPFQKHTLRHILNERYQDKLQDYTPQTLLIAGEKDAAVPILSLELLQKILHCQLERLPTGHFPHHELPTQTSTLILEFLK